MGENKGKNPEMDVEAYRDMGGARPKWKPKPQDKVSMKDADLSAFDFRCEKCRQSINNMDCIDTPNGLFHTECFTCQTCAKQLVGEYLTVNDVFYHPECLVCGECQVSLIGEALMCTPEKKLYCARDAPRDRCTGCSERCESGRVIQVEERTWHEACFACAECHTKLAGHPFMTHEHRFYCKGCYQTMHAPKCARCFKNADGPVLKVKVPDGAELLFHERCYTCQQCKAKLRGKGSYPFNADIFCKQHYDEVRSGR